MKTIDIAGLVYDQEAGSLVDYGFGKLYSLPHKSNALTHTCSIEDKSICPPLHEDLASDQVVEFKNNGEYKAKILRVNELNSWIEIVVNDTEVNCLDKQIIYFSNLAKYWGSKECLYKNYKKDDTIDVKFIQTKTKSESTLRVFCEKGVRMVSFSSLTYEVGDEINTHVGPTDEMRPLIWLNRRAISVHPNDDAVFVRRIANNIYYPGYPIKVEVSNIETNENNGRIFKFTVLHKYVDYGIKEGDYPCIIRTNNWKKEITITANSDNQERTYIFEIPHTDLPKGAVNKKTKQATVRICGFDKIGEPIIRVLPAEKVKDEVFENIRRGNIESATIIEKHEKYCEVMVKNRKAVLINYPWTDDEIKSVETVVAHVDAESKFILCTPAVSETTVQSDIQTDSKISLPMITIFNNHVICGNGVHSGIIRIEDWDWFGGKTLTPDYDRSLYTKMVVKEVAEEGILILSRRELLENPWEKTSITADQSVDITFVEIAEKYARVLVENIIADVQWKEISPYPAIISTHLFHVGQTAQMLVKHIDTCTHTISFTYPPEKGIPSDVAFPKEQKFPATIVKVTDKGLIIKVNDIYGFVKQSSMLAGYDYSENQTIDVKLFNQYGHTDSRYFGFSHVAMVDPRDIFKYKNVIEAKLEAIDEERLVFSASGHWVYCHRTYAKYFSAERDVDFADSMQIGQTYTLRIVDAENRRAVPNGMPDYSIIEPGTEYVARIHEIGEKGYHIYIDKFNDIFYVLFAKYCDWSNVHIETRHVNDDIKVNMVAYMPEENLPMFSLIAKDEDPWAGINKDDIIKVKRIGSLLKKDDFYVSVNGVPVKLSSTAICCMLKSPWIGTNILYSSLEKLEEVEEFEMDVISIDKDERTISLMPHVGEIPKYVYNSMIIRKKGSIWVRYKNIIGRLPDEEIPEGYELGYMLEQAICKSYDRNEGYAILSIKDLYGNANEIKDEIHEEEAQPQGIHVTEDTDLKVDQIVRGKVNNVNHSKCRIFIHVGPYLGFIKYNDLSNMICDAPGSALEVDKEYDFCICRIYDNAQGKLLQLTRKPLQPVPPARIPTGKIVNATVLRHGDGLIVASLNEYNGIEAVIHPHDLAGCAINDKVIYPKRGFKFKAKIAEVQKTQAGNIIRITLTERE